MPIAVIIVYVVGVAIGLWRVDGSPAARVIVAALWPLGVLAGVVTVSGLILIGMVVFPMVGVACVALAALAWWLAS